jgi:probable rRNA maturation factor
MAIPVSVDLQLVADVADPPDEFQVGRWVEAALRAAGASSATGFDLAVRLVDEDESQALNKRYRQQDKPTNVLSFSFDGLAGLPAEAVRPLGDLVICVPVVEREAKERGKKLHEHWAQMVIHGTLHLLGHDHHAEEQANLMEALEARILQEFGIENPYR